MERIVWNLIVKERLYTKDYIHKFSKWLVNMAVNNNVSKIVVGAMSKDLVKMIVGSRPFRVGRSQ
ncbi:MAG: hypothetical protein ACXADA_01260 [Candidatus Hodarchaeales archaeon]|jgi:putative transposase